MNSNPLFAALSNQRRFIIYRLVPRADGKTDKIPTHPLTGENIDAQAEANWLYPHEAELWAAQWGQGYGVGLVISEGSGLFCIDLDSCRAGGGWQPHVANFIGRFPGAYTEASVSGNGVHIIGTTAAVPAHCTRNKDYRAECYTRLRFIAIAGIGAQGSPLTDLTQQLATFCGQFFPPHGDIDHGVEWTDKPVPQWRGPADDDALLARALRSASANSTWGGRASFADLWRANADALARSFPAQSAHQSWDGSAADQALANHLSFWTGNDCERMLRLMFRSGLVRTKWERQDYMRSTILRACGDQREWYAEAAAIDAQPAQDAAGVTSYTVAVPAAPTTMAAPPPTASVAEAISTVNQFLPATQAAHVLTFDSRNRYESSLPNLIAVLSKQELAMLGFDTFRGQVMIAPAATSQWQVLTDTDMVRLREALERRGFAAIGKDLMRDALQKVAEDNSYDSAITWLNGLMWDGKPRIETFLPAYCGAVDDDYTRAVSRYIWTGLAARVFDPGCQLDMVVALQSKQGTRKSTGIQSIAPLPDYFTDGVTLQEDNDNFKRLLRGKLVVEIAELAGLTKADVTHVKRVITRRTEEWVEKWQTLATSYKRRCMLFASTNNEQFLPQDDTGQRRWLPIEIVLLDDERITTDRDQLWAEGAALWRARKEAGQHGVDWKDAEHLAAGRHKKYELSDVWESVIEKWLNDPVYDVNGNVLLPPPRSRPLTINDVLAGAIHLSAAQMDARAEKRAGHVMRLLGFEKRSVRLEGSAHPVKRWVPMDAPRT